MFQTFLGDFNLQTLPSRRLQTLWEAKNRVLLEEYYIFNVVIPLEHQLCVLHRVKRCAHTRHLLMHLEQKHSPIKIIQESPRLNPFLRQPGKLDLLILPDPMDFYTPSRMH